jgi:hypothetical protein
MDIVESLAGDHLEGEEDATNAGIAAKEQDSNGDLSDVDVDALQTNGRSGDKNDEEMEKKKDDNGNNEAAMPKDKFLGKIINFHFYKDLT